MSSPEILKEYHRLEVDGRKIVYDVNELLVFEVDDAIWGFYDAAEAGAGKPEQAVARIWGATDAAEVVADLREMNLLVRPHQVASEPEPPRKDGMLGVTLNVMHGCNLACTYCFAQQGDYGLGTKKMTVDTARAAVDWLDQNRGTQDGVRVGFFGGEPMLNMKAIRDTVGYADEKLERNGRKPKYHITTNGTLLNDENVEFIADNRIDVQVSLDGVPKVNDHFRIYKNGRGSHADVAEGVARLKSRTGTATLRGTVPTEYPEFAESLWHMAEELGATNVGFEPAEISTPGGVANQAVMDTIKREWERIADDFEAHARAGTIKPVSNLLKVLRKIHTRSKALYGCTAGHANVAVDPSGDVYPCHRFVGEDDWKMGNLHDGTLNEDIRRSFAANTVDNREPCKTCWVRYTCGGRCAHEAKEATGAISEPDPVRCDMIRHMTELCLQLYVRLRDLAPEALSGRASVERPASRAR